jgi:hypothetical protein
MAPWLPISRRNSPAAKDCDGVKSLSISEPAAEEFYEAASDRSALTTMIIKPHSFTAQPQAPAYRKADTCGWAVNNGVD